jgi:hypothetical protein
MTSKIARATLVGSGAALALLLAGAPTAATAAPNPPASTNAVQGAQTRIQFQPGIPGRSASLIVDAPTNTRLIGVDDSTCRTNAEGTQVTCNRGQWVNRRTITLVVAENAPLGADLTGGRVRFEDGGSVIAEAPFGIHVVAKQLLANVTTDPAARTATVSGTGQPGAVITVVGGPTPVNVEVPASGVWSLTVGDLPPGSTALTVTQSAAGVPDQVLERSATIPVVAPTVNAFGDPIARTVAVSGSGEPGATIEVSGPTGTETTEVQSGGDWSLELTGVPWGEHEITAEQTIGSDKQSASTTVTLKPLELHAEVTSTDPQTGSAELTGQGHPGAAIELVGPGGTVTAEVQGNGSWTATVQGLSAGENAISITQRVTGAEPSTVDLDIVIADTPMLHPAAASGAGIAALALIGAALMRRRHSAS